MKSQMTTFFLFLSKTNLYIFAKVNNAARQIRIGLGVFVFCTAVLAFFAAFYVARSIFTEYNVATATTETPLYGWIISISLGLLWSLMIMDIQRDIVSAKSKWSALAWLPFAVAIGLIIAAPVKLHIFSDQINKEFTMATSQKNEPRMENRRDSIAFYNNKCNELHTKIAAEHVAMSKWAAAIETDIVGCMHQILNGIAESDLICKTAERKHLIHNSFIEYYEQQLKETRHLLIELRESPGQYSEKTEINHNLLSKYEMLVKIGKSDPSVKYLSLVLLLLILFLQIIPPLFRILSPPNEYDIMEAKFTAR